MLLVPEEYLLRFPFVPKRVLVCAKEHARFFSCLAFEIKSFPQGLDGVPFPLGVTFFSTEIGCG